MINLLRGERLEAEPQTFGVIEMGNDDADCGLLDHVANLEYETSRKIGTHPFPLQ